MRADLAIVGGGPAGLAVAIEAARRGIETRLYERRQAPLDKACGEGLMPEGVEALRAWGALERIAPAQCAPFAGIRYLQEDGSGVEALFPEGHGLGIRRTALVAALAAIATEVGAQLRFGVEAHLVGQDRERVLLATDEGEVEALLAIAADGLASPIRRRLGLAAAPSPRRRFGMRRHFARPPWSDRVEVHWGEGVEAYVTPAGASCVGVAFLWDEARIGPQRFESLLARFPLLATRLAGAEAASRIRGAGPLEQRVRRRSCGRVLLAGDAAGYVDALSGEGLSLAFRQALALGPLLPAMIAGRGEAFEAYEAVGRALFRRYALVTGGLLFLSRFPALRRPILHFSSERPALFRYLFRRLFATPAFTPPPGTMRGARGQVWRASRRKP